MRRRLSLEPMQIAAGPNAPVIKGERGMEREQAHCAAGKHGKRPALQRPWSVEGRALANACYDAIGSKKMGNCAFSRQKDLTTQPKFDIIAFVG